MTLTPKRLSHTLMIACACLCSSMFVSCTSDSGIEVISNEDTPTFPDSPSEYVVPVSSTDFEILGTRVNIFDLANSTVSQMNKILSTKSGLPDNYTSIQNGEVIYADLPSFTTEYSISDLNGFYIAQVDEEDGEARVATFVGSYAYIYSYVLNNGAWERESLAPGLDYIQVELTEKDNNCIDFSFELPAIYREAFIAQYMLQGGTREQAEAMLADNFATTTIRIIDIDRDNHVLLAAIHYSGEAALEVAADYGLAGDDNDFWVIDSII